MQPLNLQEILVDSQSLLDTILSEQRLLIHSNNLEELSALTIQKETLSIKLIYFFETMLKLANNEGFSQNWQGITAYFQKHQPAQTTLLDKLQTIQQQAKQEQHLNAQLLEKRSQDIEARLQTLLQQQDHEVVYSATGRASLNTLNKTSQQV